MPAEVSGRRRYATRTVGAVLALLAGAAFILLIVGQDDSRDARSEERPATRLERQAERVEGRLRANPDNRRLLPATMRAWIAAGSDILYKVDLDTQPIPAAVSEDYRNGLRAWDRYLRLSGERKVGAEVAEQAGDTYFRLVEIGSRNLDELEADAVKAARALLIAGRYKRTTFTLSNAAIYAWFAGRFTAGDHAANGAVTDADVDSEDAVRTQLESYRERAEFFRGQLRRAAKELEASAEEELDAPLRGYASSVGINKEDPRG